MTRHSTLSFVVFIFTGILFILSACHHPVPFVDRPQIAAGVQLQDVSFKSKAMNHEMRYRAFLPATIKTGDKFPVVYLLHGCGGDLREWSNYSQVSEYAAKGYMLVIPSEECSYYVNSHATPEDKYEDYTTQDLIADVESRFPAKSGRESRAIVGVSMGGFGAVDYALLHPELYSFVGGLSPAVDVPGRKFSLRHYDQWMRFRHIFGSTGSAERDARDPFKLVETANPLVTPYLYITAGEQESMFDSIKRFAGRLKARGFAYEFHTKPGFHDWQEWNQQLNGCMSELVKRIK